MQLPVNVEIMMIKITALLFVIIAPTIMGIGIVALLAMSSPITGGGSISQGFLILMIVAGAAIASLPISFFIAKMINNQIAS